MKTDLKNKKVMGFVIFPIIFYLLFLACLCVLMKLSLLPTDYVFIRFHLLTTALLCLFLWAGRDSKCAALASVAGVLAPLVVLVTWFLLKAFVLYSDIEWTEDNFRGAISFSALLGVVSPLVFFNEENLKFWKK